MGSMETQYIAMHVSASLFHIKGDANLSVNALAKERVNRHSLHIAELKGHHLLTFRPVLHVFLDLCLGILVFPEF